ncbi:expressed unknown protein [Seminavis robusta]|uniref:Uncharacterized protein n=1 Tax=Seminavis robusta TaxID=568900 RepID=A0A9N8EKL0_9STRA|nr:expressed unknown protein [Seminavis robusta]|eukprot:Sro1341_g264520.1 n/a (205) ;mRNA; f:27044-27740
MCNALSDFMSTLMLEGASFHDEAIEIVQDNCHILPNSKAHSMRSDTRRRGASCCGLVCRWGGPAPRLAPMTPKECTKLCDDDDSRMEDFTPLFDFNEVMALAATNQVHGAGGSRTDMGGSLHSSFSSLCSDSPPRSPVRKASITLETCSIPIEELSRLALGDDNDSSSCCSMDDSNRATNLQWSAVQLLHHLILGVMRRSLSQS